MAKILIVDDEPFNLDVLEQELADRGYAVERAANGAAALACFEASHPDLILLDYQMPDMNGIEVMKELKGRGNEAPVVLLTAYGTIERAVLAMKEGAYDFIPKPFEPEHLALVVEKALERETLRRDLEILSEELDERHRLVVGHSAKMSQAVESARKAAASKATVLLLGESGTGKEIVARSIHRWSERRDKPFIAVNCVGLSKDLLESELFGHEKGAFTGAHQLKKGKMERADGGTIFFDEVGDIGPEVQTKLLRFLQEREFERVGGGRPIRVDVRVLAATNRHLESDVKQGRFREDLFYRLNVVPIVLPPLRERPEDIPSLAEFFLKRFANDTKKSFEKIAPEVMARLCGYDWPGNVRELGNVIERAVVLDSGPQLALSDFPLSHVAAESSSSAAMSYHQAIDAARRDLVQKALAEAQGNRTEAAKLLGLHKTHLFRLLKSLKIDEA
jgi:DNA-binding NtrC family response regulator